MIIPLSQEELILTITLRSFIIWPLSIRTDRFLCAKSLILFFWNVCFFRNTPINIWIFFIFLLIQEHMFGII
jgi:hypothetical protein